MRRITHGARLFGWITLLGCASDVGPPAPPFDAGRPVRETDSGCFRCGLVDAFAPPPDDAGPLEVCRQPLGEPCDETGCERLTCVLPSTALVSLEDGTRLEATRFPTPICSVRCDPAVAGSCGDCGVCVGHSLLGRARVDLGDPIDGICRARCGGGCAPGYTCDEVTGACLEACASDAQCAIAGEDGDGDGSDDVFRSEAGFHCDRAAGRCAPLGERAPCDDDLDCNGGRNACLRSSAGGSMCAPFCSETCELSGGTCAPIGMRAGSSFDVCAARCNLHAEPPEDRLGATGHGAGCPIGFACREFAHDRSPVCMPANYNDVLEPNLLAPCASDLECYSPYGLGTCSVPIDGGRACALPCEQAIASGADPVLVCDPARFVCDRIRGCELP